MIPRAGLISLATCNGRKLLVELLEDGLVGRAAVTQVLWLLIPCGEGEMGVKERCEKSVDVSITSYASSTYSRRRRQSHYGG